MTAAQNAPTSTNPFQEPPMSDQPFPPVSNEPVAATATEAALLESALMEMKKVIVGQDRAIGRSTDCERT